MQSFLGLKALLTSCCVFSIIYSYHSSNWRFEMKYWTVCAKPCKMQQEISVCIKQQNTLGSGMSLLPWERKKYRERKWLGDTGHGRCSLWWGQDWNNALEAFVQLWVHSSWWEFMWTSQDLPYTVIPEWLLGGLVRCCFLTWHFQNVSAYLWGSHMEFNSVYGEPVNTIHNTWGMIHLT